MSAAAPAFGSPEYVAAVHAACRAYDVPEAFDSADELLDFLMRRSRQRDAYARWLRRRAAKRVGVHRIER